VPNLRRIVCRLAAVAGLAAVCATPLIAQQPSGPRSVDCRFVSPLGALPAELAMRCVVFPAPAGPSVLIGRLTGPGFAAQKKAPRLRGKPGRAVWYTWSDGDFSGEYLRAPLPPERLEGRSITLQPLQDVPGEDVGTNLAFGAARLILQPPPRKQPPEADPFRRRTKA
jgi:hypothetical protein